MASEAKAGKVSFSDRQKLRKMHALSEESAPLEGGGAGGSGGGAGGGGLPLFRGHSLKPDRAAVSFSDRQKQRKAGELVVSDESKGVIGHRVQGHVSFSERVKQRKRGPVKEAEALACVDSDYGSTWMDDMSDSSPSESPLSTSEAAVLLEPIKEASIAPIETVAAATTAAATRPWFKLRLGATGKRLMSGAIAGGVSRTVVAPLETIRTHLMVGNSGKKSIKQVYEWIMETEGWKGLFRGNSLNVLRVAPAKAIELFTYDTVKRALTPKDGSPSRIPFPISSIAGSSAGIASCTLTYPLELVKTRLTVQPEAYKGVIHAFYRIITEEGISELYRGLTPSIIGIIPYAGTNFFAYDTLRTMYRKVTKQKKIGSVATLFIGSSAGAFAATVTFPLEVARKQMQVGALKGRVVYKGTLDCIQCILKEQGIKGLYKGLVPSCIKLMPAAGISFMCYEALKRFLIDEE